MSIAESFGQSGFAKFMGSPASRAARIVMGLGFIGAGFTMRGESVGVGLMVIGLAPLAAGVFNWCYISALLGGPLDGAKLGKGNPPA